MKKIGIFLQSTYCDNYLFKTIESLTKSDLVELFFLICQKNIHSDRSESGSHEGKYKNCDRRGGINGQIFSLVADAEYAILKMADRSIGFLKEKRNIEPLVKNEIIYLTPQRTSSGCRVSFSDNETEALKKLELDLLLIGSGTEKFEKEVFSFAKDGIIALEHTDNRWNRGGPPSFWEVYFRYPSAGFTIRKLDYNDEYNQVLYRGDIAITSTYTKSLIRLYSRSYYYLTEFILKFAINNHLPSPEKNLPYSGRLSGIPSLGQSIRYCIKTIILLIHNALERSVLKKQTRWGVAFCCKSWRDSNLSEGVRIKNPADHFFADPFVVKRNGKTVCFVEDYSFREKIGYIAAIEILNEKEYKLLGPIIKEPFHMSYPFVFEYDQDLYMIPETSGAKSIRLYKCSGFPLNWEYQKDILTGDHFVDPMIINHNGLWYILTNTEDEKLVAFHSNDPINGEWIKHEIDPLLFDLNISRNGGLLREADGSYVRCRQKFGFNTYGAALTMAKIIELSPENYVELDVCKVSPDFFPGLIGCHHMHSNGETTVYDYLRVEKLN